MKKGDYRDSIEAKKSLWHKEWIFNLFILSVFLIAGGLAWLFNWLALLEGHGAF